MDQSMLEKMIRMMASTVDADALMGLRGAQGLFDSEGSSFSQALKYAGANIDTLRAMQQATTIDQASSGVPAVVKSATAVVNVSGMPDCRMPKAGHIEIVLSGKAGGDVIALPGASAADAEVIATSFKDALVAAVINKSRFKLKLIDIKNKRGDIIETALQAEYERAGMTPVRVWGNVKGEVAALAAVLRKAVASNLPELVAA